LMFFIFWYSGKNTPNNPHPLSSSTMNLLIFKNMLVGGMIIRSVSLLSISRPEIRRVSDSIAVNSVKHLS
jgi:hypothetical protein